MDPAAFSPPRELQEAVVNSASKLINQWLEHEGEAPLYAVEANLQHLISGYPWLLDSLHPLVQNFVLHELHLHPPASTACLLASTEDVLSEPPDEGLPGPSEPSPKKKRRSRHRRGTPQPAVRTYKQPAVVSERDTVSALSDTRAIYSGAIFCISTLDTSVFSVSSMAKASKTVFLEPMSCVNDCVHSAAAKPGITEPGIMNSENENIWDSFSSALVFSGEAVNLTETVLPDHVLTSTLSPQFNVGSAIQLAFQSAGQLPSVQSAGQLPSVLLASPPPITPSLQSSPLPVGQSVAAPLPIAQLPLVHLSAHSPIQPPSSLSHSKQRTHFTTTSAGSLKLATSETVTPSRASPEAGCHSPANSGPLEAKTPAPAAPPENSPEQSRLSAPPESSSEFTHLPPSSECIGEHFQPSEDCIPLLLPECSHCAAQSQRVSTLTEVCVPAASVSVSAGGPEEPTQHHTSLAEGPGGPRQHVLPSAGGPGRSVQPSPAESSLRHLHHRLHHLLQHHLLQHPYHRPQPSRCCQVPPLCLHPHLVQLQLRLQLHLHLVQLLLRLRLAWPCSAFAWPCLAWPCGCHTVMGPSSSCSAFTVAVCTVGLQTCFSRRHRCHVHGRPPDLFWLLC
ncbi:uncharacterized protein LOC112844578 [Oreochromis niloticus]|uniref:uncharacterized protein LOC112844578 n=1 Tax=Oreochromis niloticus TaxID=8128 RepID=UPI000DF48B99|nr:uncharacterized protein LOC112844578 [Oreochromis niloticus]